LSAQYKYLTGNQSVFCVMRYVGHVVRTSDSNSTVMLRSGAVWCGVVWCVVICGAFDGLWTVVKLLNVVYTFSVLCSALPYYCDIVCCGSFLFLFLFFSVTTCSILVKS
jgi:hypothetical protein